MAANKLKESYGTLSETINGLNALGYTHDFNIKDECLVCNRTNISLSPDEFQIDKVYRFDGDSDPEYQSILYAISSEKFGVKGTLVNGYGIFSDDISSKLIEKLNTHHGPRIQPVKTNEATPQRPEGDRILDGPMVQIDLKKTIRQIKNESVWKNGDRNSITVFKSDTMRIVLIGLHEKAELKPHKANGVISVQVLEGRIEFSAAKQVMDLSEGQMVTLQSNIVHSVKAKKESVFLLTLAMST